MTNNYSSKTNITAQHLSAEPSETSMNIIRQMAHTFLMLRKGMCVASA